MKKFLSLCIVVLLLMSVFGMFAFASEPENVASNISPLGIAYCTSEKNSLWTPAKSISDGKNGTNDWHGWECKYPSVEVGQDTSMGFGGEFCGIKFENNYYSISQIKMNIGLHTKSGGQNAKYDIQALIDGKWKTIGVLKDDQAKPVDSKYPDYNSVMSDPNASHRVVADLVLNLETPIITNNVRVVVSEYAKNYEGGDVLIFPFIYELEIYGVSAPAPEIILPEGAWVSTDVAWYSYPNAPQGANGTYPFLAIDGNDDTYWELLDYKGNEYFTLMLDKEYELGKVEVLLEKTGNKYQSTLLEYYSDNEWKSFEDTNPIININGNRYTVKYTFPATKVSGVRIKLRTAMENVRVNSFSAHLADSKTYVFENRFTKDQLNSISCGNVAIIGKPYSNVSFAPYSDESYIIDGLKNDANVWFTGSLEVPAYCGVKFDYPQRISGATISTRVSSTIAREIMKFEIQALINGEYVKLADGRSFANGKYETEYSFDEVETTDVRVVIKEANGAIPNLMELELFSKNNAVLTMFAGIEKYENEEETKPSVPNEDVVEEANKVEFVHFLPLITIVLAIIIIYVVKKLINKRKQINSNETNDAEQSE